MSRRVILACLVASASASLSAGVAHADDPPPAIDPPIVIDASTSVTVSPSAPAAGVEPTTTPAAVVTTADTQLVESSDPDADPIEDMGDQGVGAAVGIASGGRVTPGGLRVTGHYLYQLSSEDWFDGSAAFTFGGGDAACFRDRMDVTICEHGFTDGAAIEIAAGVRRYFAPQGRFRPFARAAVGLSLVRFGNDDVSGFAVPLHLGGGVRAQVANGLAVVGQAELTLGIGRFNRDLGIEPQLGLAVTAGVEFRLGR